MDKLNKNLICKIEEALRIKFEDWQKDYLLDVPRILDMRITGRRTGKTTLYIIKLLFKDNKPIKAYEQREVTHCSDWFSTTNNPARSEPLYTNCFKRYLQDIYEALTEKGISPRPVFFSREGEKKYYKIV